MNDAQFLAEVKTWWMNAHLDFTGSYLEKPVDKELINLRYQLRYVYQEIGPAAIAANHDNKKNKVVSRVANLLLNLEKTMKPADPPASKTPAIRWQTEADLTANELMDLYIALQSQLGEFYLFMLKPGETFHLNKLADHFQLPKDFLDRHDAKKKIYDELAERAGKKYGLTLESLWVPLIFELRNSASHLDYSYEKTTPFTGVVLSTTRLSLVDLFRLTKTIAAKVNVLMILPLTANQC